MKILLVEDAFAYQLALNKTIERYNTFLTAFRNKSLEEKMLTPTDAAYFKIESKLCVSENFAIELFKNAIKEKNPFEIVFTDTNIFKNEDDKLVGSGTGDGVTVIREIRQHEADAKLNPVAIHSISSDDPLSENTQALNLGKFVGKIPPLKSRTIMFDILRENFSKSNLLKGGGTINEIV